MAEGWGWELCPSFVSDMLLTEKPPKHIKINATVEGNCLDWSISKTKDRKLCILLENYSKATFCRIFDIWSKIWLKLTLSACKSCKLLRKLVDCIMKSADIDILRSAKHLKSVLIKYLNLKILCKRNLQSNNVWVYEYPVLTFT